MAASGDADELATRGGGAPMPPELGQAQAVEGRQEGDGGDGQVECAPTGKENAVAAVAVVDAGVGQGSTARVPSSISKHKVVEHSKIKRKSVDLKTLWSRSKKKPNVQIEEQIDISSVQVQQQVPSDQIHQQVQSSCPSVQDASVQIQQQPENGIGTSASAAKESEVERIFSSMTFVKNKLRNKMGNQMLNDCLVTFTEKEFFLQVKDDAVISCFQAMEDRMVVL